MSRKRERKELLQYGQLQKVLKTNSKKSRLNLCDLPNELIEKMIGFIPHWHRHRLRESCRRVRSICDAVLIHEFNSAIFHYGSEDPVGYELAALTGIKAATWNYVKNGFESTFCGAMMPLIWDNNHFSPHPEKIKCFLKHFYRLVNDKIGNSQFSRLLYSMTLMELLKKFKSSCLTASMLIPPNYWRIVLELHGPWLGVMYTPKPVGEPQESIKLLMILCDMLIENSTQPAYKKLWECDSEVFIYGNDTSERIFKNQRTVFTFKISAPKSIVSLLKSCLGDEEVVWPNRLPRNEFVILIDISCKKALKWGCSQVYHIEIGNFSNQDGEDEEDDCDYWSIVRTFSSEIIFEIE